MLALDVVAKVGALIDAEQAVDTRDNPADLDDAAEVVCVR